MLYTVRPLERIYASPDVFDHNRKRNPKDLGKDDVEYREVSLPNGRIVTRRSGENYVIESISSTDMLDYLNNEYIPGMNYLDAKE